MLQDAGCVGVLTFCMRSSYEAQDLLPLEMSVLKNIPDWQGGAGFLLKQFCRKHFSEPNGNFFGTYKAWIYIRGKNDAMKGNMETFLGDRIKASLSSCQNFHDKPFISGLVF